MWLEGNPLHPQSLVPMLRQLASERPPDLREIGLDADQVRLVLQYACGSMRCMVTITVMFGVAICLPCLQILLSVMASCAH